MIRFRLYLENWEFTDPQFTESFHETQESEAIVLTRLMTRQKLVGVQQASVS